ncbi:hypothetical protein PROFUN_05819 [Planoprotostelium fungivorum]|uniref:Uncharacterized protein n=1 Tax=Planoprotostelium fungivorum TaxID=1890364 RepID=A0A2P6NQ68_9EUKA|nr:hypothetical protein PROFUN_05819 [Planoprotostelium fungivorum]
MAQPSEAALVQQNLMKAEVLAEDILIDKQQLIDLDRRRNTNREALRQITDAKKRPLAQQEKKTWLCMRDIFILLPTDTAESFISKDQKMLDEKINTTRDELKHKTSKLSQIEGAPDHSKPFFLNPINK